MQHLSRLLDAPLAASPDRLAARGSDGDFTYAELDRRAAALARALTTGGISTDEPVAVRVGNRALDLAGFLGIWRAGGVAVPIHRTTPERVTAELLRRSGARFLVESAEVSRPDPLRGPPVPRALLTGAALVIFTSGTTGTPKGVVLTHAGFAGKLATIDSVFPFPAETRTLLLLQLTFSFGQWVSLLTLHHGGTLVLHERFEVERALAALAEERIERLGIVPTMMRALLPLLAGSGISRDGIPRLFMAGGETMAAGLSRAWRAALPEAALADIYGLTETSTCDFFLPSADQDRFPGTIGTPMPQVDYTLFEGELAIRTPFVMAGYLDEPELTASAFRDGYFRTGDLAERTQEGRVRLVGRAKELIHRAGNKVSPLEVERVFLEHPEIQEALATGLPDPRLGEAIHLLIVPAAGASPRPQELRAWAASRLERYKLPDAIHFGSAIPLGRTGKADRAALRISLQDAAKK